MDHMDQEKLDKAPEQAEEELLEELEDDFEEEELVDAVDNNAPFYYDTPISDTEVIGVRFRNSSKIYYFDPDGKNYAEGDRAIVETARGQEYGIVAQANHVVSGRDIVLPLRKVVRPATTEDEKHDAENRRKAEEAFEIATKKIEEHGLDMKLIESEYTFDNSKLLFYFTSDGRVDFRDLVKDLASVFRCRIELRQMGIRDEAKILGGLGICGRPFCCHAFLPDFVQVSIKMAKEQNLALNSAKISGACGRLMCCLRYEYDAYLEEGKLTPKVDSLVNTPDGIGVVVEAKPLVGMVKVKSLNDGASTPKVYHRDQLTPIRKGDENYEKAQTEKSLEKQARAAGTTRAALKAAMNETPEKAAERAARLERSLLRVPKEEPKKATSYTGQVTPVVLQSKEVEQPDEENDDNKLRHRSRRGRGRNRNGRKPDVKEQKVPETAAPRYEKVPRAPEKADEHPAQTPPADGNAKKKSRRTFYRHNRGNKNNKPQ